MKKVLSSSIFALIIIVAAIGVGIAIGVTATTNAQKSMEFSVSVKNEPAFNLVVNLNVTTASGTTTTKIFDSRNQTTVVKTFIDSITTDTINLDSAKIFENPNVTAASLDVYNYTENIKISVAVNSSENPLLLADYNGTEAPTPTNVPIESGNLGITITSLKFEIAAFKTFATLNADGVFTVDASADGTADHVDYDYLTDCVWTGLDDPEGYSNSRYVPWYHEDILSVVFTNNITNTNLNISYWFYELSLTSVDFGNFQLTAIGKEAFYYCSRLESITIPDSVTTIGNNAFDTCIQLTSVIIPSSVTEICFKAFSDCSSLTIYCEAASQPSGWDSYWNSSNCPVVWGYTGN